MSVETKAQHTPGPWGEPFFDDCGKFSKEGPCEGGWTIPELPIGRHGFLNESDARLVSAAPELLKATQAIIPNIRILREIALEHYELSAFGVKSIADTFNRLLAAIQKATGEGP